LKINDILNVFDAKDIQAGGIGQEQTSVFVKEFNPHGTQLKDAGEPGISFPKCRCIGECPLRIFFCIRNGLSPLPLSFRKFRIVSGERWNTKKK